MIILSKIVFQDVETTFRHTFLSSELQCISSGEPRNLCANTRIRLLATHSLLGLRRMSYKLGFLVSVVVQSQIAVSLKRTREGTCWSACVVSIECSHGWAMADLSKVLSLNQERVNSMESKTLKTRTKVNTVRGRPAVRELYERSIYERTIMSERSIEGCAISNLRICSCLACVYRVVDARGKFGEHEKCVRVARGAAESNSSFLSALQTSQVHP